MLQNVAMIALALLALTSTYIIIRGPTAWDRLQGLAVLSSKVVIVIVLLSLYFDQSYLADLAIVFSLLGFVSIVLISRYIGRRRS